MKAATTLPCVSLEKWSPVEWKKVSRKFRLLSKVLEVSLLETR